MRGHANRRGPGVTCGTHNCRDAHRPERPRGRSVCEGQDPGHGATDTQLPNAPASQATGHRSSMGPRGRGRGGRGVGLRDPPTQILAKPRGPQNCPTPKGGGGVLDSHPPTGQLHRADTHKGFFMLCLEMETTANKETLTKPTHAP